MRHLSAKGEVGDGNIVDQDVELFRAGHQVFPHLQPARTKPELTKQIRSHHGPAYQKALWRTSDGSLEEQAAHRTGHPITLRQQLLSIVLGYNCLEDLIADGWQNPLIPVQPKAPVDLGQHSRVWL